MEPPRRRPDGHVEDVPDQEWLALPPEDRAAVLLREANPSGLATFDPTDHPAYAAAVQAICDRRRDAAGRPRMDLHPVEDGPGAGVRLEFAVRVLVGTERSTVIVADPITGRALSNTVVALGGEPGAAATAVEAAVRAWLPE